MKESHALLAVPHPTGGAPVTDPEPHQPPEWWPDLYTDPASAELGIDWSPADDWEAESDDPADQWGGGIVVPGLVELDRERRAGMVCVGRGPGVARRGIGYDVTVYWYLDPQAPDTLWCALGAEYPSWLWFPVPPTVAGLREALSDVLDRPSLRRPDLPASVRGFLGYRRNVQVPHVYSGEFVEFNGADLARYFSGVDYVEPRSWGSVRVDDPLRDDVGAVSPLTMMALGRADSAQRLGMVPSMTWRTLHSRSYLSIEVHGQELVCASVRYRPSPASHRGVVARLNERTGRTWPEDLPLDVIGALTGYGFDRADDLAHNLEHPDRIASMVWVLAALWQGDLRRTRRLREYATHPDPAVRRAVVRMASWYNYRFLLYDVALVETDPETLGRIDEVLTTGGNGPDTFNAFQEYFGNGAPVLVDFDGTAVPTWSDGDDDEDGTDDEDAGDAVAESDDADAREGSRP
ncbi:MAG: hypothetical protein WCA46_04350 [Actinocatenispora sp.]